MPSWTSTSQQPECPGLAADAQEQMVRCERPPDRAVAGSPGATAARLGDARVGQVAQVQGLSLLALLARSLRRVVDEDWRRAAALRYACPASRSRGPISYRSLGRNLSTTGEQAQIQRVDDGYLHIVGAKVLCQGNGRSVLLSSRGRVKALADITFRQFHLLRLARHALRSPR